MGKKRKLQEFSQVGRSFNANDAHSQKMRGSEMESHFGRVSTVVASVAFEGGIENESPGMMDFDDGQISEGNELEYDEEEMLIGGGNKGSMQAEDIIKKQIIGGAQDVNLINLDLQSLNFMANHYWPTLKEVYISRNMIQSLDTLNDYRSLKIIDASHNFISEVSLALPKLTLLNLQYNRLTEFPKFENCNKLYELNLNSNELTNIETIDSQQTINLIKLDLGSNQFEFDNHEHIHRFVKKLCTYPKLGHLRVDDNPFWLPQQIEEKYPNVILEEKFMEGLQLEIFNGMDMGQLRKLVQEKIALMNEGQEDQQQVTPSPSFAEVSSKRTKKSSKKSSIMSLDEEEKEKKQMDKPPKSLQELINYLEDANCHPEQSLAHLSELANSADDIVLKLDQVEQYLAPGKTEGEMAELIETFIQNSLLLIDNYFDMQNIMMTILAKLSVIKFQNFGLNCFKTLKDLMISGRDLEEQVQSILKTEVIEKMKVNDPHKIPVTLLQGLHQLIEDTGDSEMLQSMFDVNFPTWLRKYCGILEQCKIQKMVMGNDEHYDSIISLLSVSVKDNDTNVELVKEKELLPLITQIIKQSTLENDRYIPTLQLIACLANADYEIADYFVQNLVQNIVLNQIKKSMKIYKKLNSLFDENSKDTVEQQRLKYQSLSAEITTLGGLLQASSELKEPILNDPILKDLLSLMSHEITDPILLTAICTFALDLFECDELKYNEEFMMPFHAKISDMKHLIPYLGFEKYYPLLDMTKIYHGAVTSAQKDDGDDDDGAGNLNLEPKEEDEESVDSDAEYEKYQAEIQQSMKHLDDPIVSDLFISIINLMRFFCLEAENYEDNQNVLFDAVSYSLNQNNREAALFNCLNVPDDNVKLAVVSCLFVVPLDELESDEITQITAIMSQCNNIGAGKTELVLSTVYWICYKLSVGDPEEIDSSKIFQMKFGENTINEALTILQRNLIRVSDQEDDDREKYALSLSILNFIKASSQAPIMQKYMRNKSEIFRQILISEDIFSSNRVKSIPIDIENSMLGRDINTMMETITGNDTIQPYSDVSLRVLMRIADILMYRHEYRFYDIQTGSGILEALTLAQENIYKKKLSQELDYWIDIPARFHDMLDYDGRMELKLQHQNFNQGNGVALIKIFLTSKYPINEDYCRKLQDPIFNDEQEDGVKPLGVEISEKKSFHEHKFRAKYMLNEYFVRQVMFMKNKAKTAPPQEQAQPQEGEDEDDEGKKAQENVKGTGQYVFNQNMQFEEIGSDFGSGLAGASGSSKADIEFKLLEKQKEEQTKILNDPNGGKLSLKEQRGDGFLNSAIRSLTIAAFLRCLYAAIEFAPNYILRTNAIHNIRDPVMFRSITQLCDSTDWDENANIGAKYLRVMRSVIKIPLDQAQEKTEMLVHYELVACVIQKTLSKIVNKMRKDIELNFGDQVSIYEISLTFFTILQQANNFVFSDFNILHNHLMNEAKIKLKAENKIIKAKGGTLKKLPAIQDLLKDPIEGPWIPKCQFEEEKKDSDKPETMETYTVQKVTLRGKRTIQDKIVEFMVLKLFSKQSIFSLIDILFKDMNEDYKIFDPPIEDDDDEEEETPQVEAVANVEEEDIDPTKYGENIDDYMGIKGTLTIERIKDIVGEIMASCAGKMKYEILEIIMKGLVFEKKKLRESFMQEILIASESSNFKNSLERYMNENELHCRRYFPETNPEEFLEPMHERIIEYATVDVCYQYVQQIDHMLNEIPAKNPDLNFYRRIMVITSEGIQFLKELPEIQLCPNCPKFKFCPRGPVQDFCLDFLDIETVINFPQMPQKIVIKFKEDLINDEGTDGGQDFYQVTLTVPSFTKSAKIYNYLVQIISKAVQDKYDIMMNKPSSLSSKFLREELDINYMDRLVNYHLWTFVDKLTEGEVSRQKINSLQLIFASLKQSNLFTKKFWDEKIVNKVKKDFNQTKRCKPVPSSFLLEEQNVIPNQVIVCIVGEWLVLMKENWHQWQFQENKEDLKIFINKLIRDQDEQDEQPQDKEEPTGTDYVKDNEIFCTNYKTEYFQPVVMMKVESIEALEVHKGPHPTVTVQCYDFKIQIEIHFTGDMERQKFIEQLMETQEGGGEEEAAAGGQADEDESDSSDEQGNDESEEEEVKAIIYD